MSQMKAEQAYRNAKRLMRKGDYRQAALMLQLAVSKEPGNAEYKELLADAKARAAAQPKVDRRDQTLKGLEIPTGEDEQSEPSVEMPQISSSKGVRTTLGVLLILVLGVVGYFVNQPPEPAKLELSPYRTVINIIEHTHQKDSSRLKLRIESADWGELSGEEKGRTLQELYALSKDDGFAGILLIDESGKRLAATVKGEFRYFDKKATPVASAPATNSSTNALTVEQQPPGAPAAAGQKGEAPSAPAPKNSTP